MLYIDDAIKKVGSKIINYSACELINNQYGLKLYKNQEEVFNTIINPINHEIVIIEARGGGKTFSVSLSIHYLCKNIPRLKVGVFAPKFGQSKRLLGQVWEHDKKVEAIDRASSSSIHIKFKNGSEIFADSAHEKANVEGGHFHIIVIDEAHKTSDYAISNKIIPMLGSFSYYQLIKVGVALFKNNFYKSYLKESSVKCKHDWTQCDILKQSGIIEYNGKEYPKFVAEIMPLEKKLEYFKEAAYNLPKQGEISLVDFITQYELIWLENIENFLTEKQIKALGSGTHKELTEYDNSGQFLFGLDTASGSINIENLHTDWTALSIWKVFRGKFYKVACFRWRGNPMDQYVEIRDEIKKFNCLFGLIDYSNIGIAFIDMLKRDGINCEGIMYSRTEPITKKNYKIVMFENFQDNVMENIRYPKIFDDETKKILVSEDMYTSYIEWTLFERHKKGASVVLTAPPGEHDDFVNSDVLALWAAKYSVNRYVREGGMNFYFSGSKGGLMSR